LELELRLSVAAVLLRALWVVQRGKGNFVSAVISPQKQPVAALKVRRGHW
jgi:hypothetical protein